MAVTQLTSTGEEQHAARSSGLTTPMDETVMHYAELARAAGLDGVVCSPLEAAKVHGACGEQFLTVTPGVRFAGGEAVRPGARDDPRRGQASWDRIISWWAARLPGRRTRSQPGSAAPTNLWAERPEEEEQSMENMEHQIARGLLEIGAVFFRPEEPFTWASGIKSPVYCDNRLILTAPQVRTLVENGSGGD